jgi:membrane protease YdiL (CAAX protease family)
MTIVDHVMILMLFVAQPVWGRISWNWLVAKTSMGKPVAKARLYRSTLLLEWIALAVLVAVWFVFERPFADLGFVAPGGTGFAVGVVIFIAATAYLGYAWHAARGADGEEIAKMRASLGDLALYIPDTRVSYRGFVGVSITAGICEEVIYRGFVFWYLGQLMPMWAVLAVSSVAFGLGHSYQGLAGMLRTGATGLAFGLYYLLTGSIWLPILAHIVLDILQGGMLYEYYRERHPENKLQPDGSAG